MKKLKKDINFSLCILLVSTSFVISGSGIMSTIISLYLKNIGKSEVFIGKIAFTYFLGMFLGAIKTSKIIKKKGYRRSFMYLAIYMALANLMPLIKKDVIIICISRIIQGFSMSGIYIILDSWIMLESYEKDRGKNISLYMIVLYISYAISQYFIIYGKNCLEWGKNILMISTLVILVSIIPMILFKIKEPKTEQKSRIRTIEVYNVSNQGFIGCFVSGIMISNILVLLPAYIQEREKNEKIVGISMFFVFISASITQYPLGIIADKINKKKIQKIIILIYNIFLIIFFIQDYYNFINFYILLFIVSVVGIFSFAIYPISINLVCQDLSYKDIIKGTQILTMSYGIGSMIGPIYSSLFIKYLGNKGYFLSHIILIITMFRVVKKNKIRK